MDYEIISAYQARENCDQIDRVRETLKDLEKSIILQSNKGSASVTRSVVGLEEPHQSKLIKILNSKGYQTDLEYSMLTISW